MPRKQRVVNPQAARSFVAHAGQNAPATYSAFEAYCQRTGRGQFPASGGRRSTLRSPWSTTQRATPHLEGRGSTLSPSVGPTRIWGR